jgi:protein-L-isoaspartate(D-aspartate) O-methyltransferase
MKAKNSLFLLILFSFTIISISLADGNFYLLRKKMIKEQIIKRGIKDKRVLAAMLKVERHKFVPEDMKYLAYSDRPLPIGYGQTISQPYIVALMTELLGLRGNEKVLEIGTGSGYQAAILSLLCKEVYTIEILKPLAKSAEKRLKELGYTNIKVKHGDGYLGWEEYAPFDAIIVTAAPQEIPPKLIDQLKEGGKMVLPVGSVYQELKVVVKEKDKIKIKNILPVRFVPMIKSRE